MIGEADARRMAAQDAVGDAVEGTAPEAAGLVLGDLVDARQHFGCGAIGEGQEKNFVGIDATIDQMDDAIDERSRFSGSGGCENQKRSIGGG